MLVDLTIPAGLGPGGTFSVIVAGKSQSVIVPEGHAGGMRLRVQIDTNESNGDETKASNNRPDNSLMDYLIAEASENSSNRCFGGCVMIYILLLSIALFDARQQYFNQQQSDANAVAAISAALALTGYAEFYRDSFIADDDQAQECIERDEFTDPISAYEYFYNLYANGGNVSQTDLDCAETIFGGDSNDIDLCTPNEIKWQYDGDSDPSYCGMNTLNAQGCAGGFYQPRSNSNGQGPALACPPGYWCPRNLICKMPCGMGSLCLVSELQQATPLVSSSGASLGSCRYPLDALPKTNPETIFATAISSCNPSVDDDLNTTTIKCPGAPKMPLCPEGYYCPKGSEHYDCPVGHYCPRGSLKPTPCAFRIACPWTKQPYPFVFEPVAVMLAILTLVVWGGYAIFEKRRISKRDIRRIAQNAAMSERMAARKKMEEDFQREAFVDDRNNATASSVGGSTHGSSSGDLVDTPIESATGGGGGSDRSRIGTWLFLGFDAETCVALVALSVATTTGGAVLASSGTAFTFPSAELCIAVGCLGFCVGVPGAVELRRRNLASRAVAERAHQGTMARLGGLVAAAATTAMGAASSQRGKRSGTITERLASKLGSVKLLGSLREKTTTRVNLEVDKLGLRLNSNKRVVLAGVDGKIRAGSVTAIMGPSGAGKTTFLNTLCGRANYGTTTGRLLINGEEGSVNTLGRLVGFVPQEDTMHRELTVREILKAYATMRLPRSYGAAEVERVVQDVIEALQLDHIVDSTIGDEAKRGISGGQRKRVNVGMEMVADPSLLFLDEPTSGLDSTTSFDLVFALGAMASKGVNVIMVLHQPSYPLYQMFTNALLLGKGGRTVFLGKSSDALRYFTHVGFTMPPFLNPADFFMDVIAGKYDRTPRADAVECFGSEAEAAVDLFDLWRRHRVAYERGKLFHRGSAAAAEDVAAAAAAAALDAAVEPVDAVAYAGLRPAGFWRAFVVCAQRAAIQHTRAPDLFAGDILLHCLTGTFLGAASGIIDLKSLAQTNLMFSLGLTMTVGLASLRVFGNERVVFWREAAPGAGMGLSPLPYFLGKTAVELPRLALLTVCLSAFFYPFVQTMCDYSNFYWYSLMTAWNISGWATMLSIKYDDKTAQLVLVIFCLISLLYAGVQTRLGQMSGPELALSWLSPNRWMVEDLFVCHASGLSPVYRLAPTWYPTPSQDSLILQLVAFSYSEQWSTTGPNGEGADLAAISQLNIYVNFWFGFLTRTMGFLFLVYSNRSQMAQSPLRLAVLRSFNGFLRIWWPTIDLEESLRRARARVSGCADSIKTCNCANGNDGAATANTWRAHQRKPDEDNLRINSSATSFMETGSVMLADVAKDSSFQAPGEVSLEAAFAGSGSGSDGDIPSSENPMAGLSSVALAAPLISAPSPATPEAAALPAGWVAATDPATGKTYFAHSATGETSWTAPTVAGTDAGTDV